MKTFKVIENVDRIYLVKAENEDAARDLVFNGEVNPDSWDNWSIDEVYEMED